MLCFWTVPELVRTCRKGIQPCTLFDMCLVVGKARRPAALCLGHLAIALGGKVVF